jgi:putative transposase
VSEKVNLVEKYGAEYGVNRSLKVLNLSKGTWHYNLNKLKYEERYSFLKKPMLKIAQNHPDYGYRRSTTELNESDYPVNRKVVQKLQKHWNLNVVRRIKPPKPSPFRQILHENTGNLNLVKRLDNIRAFEVLYTDFTELVYCTGQLKAQLIPLLDDVSKAVLGWALGESADTDLALRAWHMCKITLKKFGCSPSGTIVHHDLDPVFTGNQWAAAILVKDGGKLSFSENGAKGNTKMESFNGKFKGENHSLFYDCKDLTELGKVVSQRIRYYNVHRRHSSLGNISPMNYLKKIGLHFRRNS